MNSSFISAPAPGSNAIVSASSSFVKADAPLLPPRGQDRDTNLINKIPPFNTNPPKTPLVPASTNMGDRLIDNDARSLWYLALPQKLTPNQVLQILRSGLGGDAYQVWQLAALMLDSWPILRKCNHELREEVSYTDFKVKPFVLDEGEGPDEDAKERADLVTRAMRGFKPNPFTDEKDFSGLVFDMCDAMLVGLSMTELIWEKRKTPKYGSEWMPRSAAWVHPRAYTFSNNGVLCLFDNDYNRLYNPLADSQRATTPDLRKFMCAQFLSNSGGALAGGLIRPLAWYWSAVIFCKEWMLSNAQKYGSPFMDMTYAPGTSAQDLAQLDAFMAQGLTQGWIRHVEGTKLEVHPSQSTTGDDNPQRHLMDEADKACLFLLLGQEGTTKSTPGKLGGEDEKSKVKRGRVEGLAQWVARGPLKQFARAVLLMNYGSDDMCPDIVPDFTESVDPMAQAQTDAVFITNKVPMLAEEFYKRNGLQMPEAGDQVLIGGQLCTLADDDEPVSSVNPDPLEMQQQMDGGGGQQPGGDEQSVVKSHTYIRHRFQPTVSRHVLAQRSIKKMLAKATPGDLEELRHLTVKAESANHFNGEWGAVVTKMNQIAARS